MPCAIRVADSSTKARPNDAIFTLWSDDDAGLASGSIAFYAGNDRYTIPFTDAVAADNRSDKHAPTAIGVHFDGPITVDSAYVATLDGRVCPVHGPSVNDGLRIGGLPSDPDVAYVTSLPKWGPIIQKIVQAAQTNPAPVPEHVAAPVCAHPYVSAAMVSDANLATPIGGTSTGAVIITLALRPDGTLAGSRVDAGFRQVEYNSAALQSVKKSRFHPEMYRCEPVSGLYRWIGYFGAPRYP